MKAILVIIALNLSIGSANAQHLKDADVPSSVKQGFEKKYPGVKVEKWEKEGVDYEAKFDLNKAESSAVFSANGTFKEFEQEIKISELLKPISDYCAKQFKDYKIDEAAKITDASGKLQYEAEMSKGKEHFDALFDAEGNFVKKSVPSTKEEDKY